MYENEKKLNESYTTKELRLHYAKALANEKNGHNKIAFKFILQVLANAPQDLTFNVRKNTRKNAFNIGDVAECVAKHFITHDKELTYSQANENDIKDRKGKNEIKTFSNSNRYPNGFTEPQGFYSISKYGVHYITKDIVKKYWADFRDYKGVQKQPTLKILKAMINNENPRLIKYLNEGLGL